MGKYSKGDRVKVEVKNDRTAESEWLWMLVNDSDDEQRLVFGILDNEPVINTDMRLGQELVVSYDTVREHSRSSPPANSD